jgi:hypothetical protein
MAFTTVPDKSSGDIFTEIMWDLYIRDNINYLKPAYGTTLPASPSDGQEAILVDSLTNPTYQWRFRYNAGSSSAYKWEFVGGANLVSGVITAENSTTTNAWVNMATVGPIVTVPRAGDYFFIASCVLGMTAATSNIQLGVGYGDFGTASFSAIASIYTAGGFVSPSLSGRANGVAAGQDWRQKYYNTVAGTMTARDRWLSVLPIRVS